MRQAWRAINAAAFACGVLAAAGFMAAPQEELNCTERFVITTRACDSNGDAECPQSTACPTCATPPPGPYGAAPGWWCRGACVRKFRYQVQVGAESQPTRRIHCSSIVGGNTFDYYPCNSTGSPCGCNLAAIPGFFNSSVK